MGPGGDRGGNGLMLSASIDLRHVIKDWVFRSSDGRCRRASRSARLKLDRVEGLERGQCHVGVPGADLTCPQRARREFS